MVGAAVMSILIGLTAAPRPVAYAAEEWRVRYVASTLREGRLRTEIDIESDGTFVERNGWFDTHTKAFVPRCADRRGTLPRSFTIGWAVDQGFRETWEPAYVNRLTARASPVLLRIERGEGRDAKTTSLTSPYDAGAEPRPDGLNYLIVTIKKLPRYCGIAP